jgi:hypothetical protein
VAAEAVEMAAMNSKAMEELQSEVALLEANKGISFNLNRRIKELVGTNVYIYLSKCM